MDKAGGIGFRHILVKNHLQKIGRVKKGCNVPNRHAYKSFTTLNFLICVLGPEWAFSTTRAKSRLELVVFAISWSKNHLQKIGRVKKGCN
jgi:hypothetical protein